MLVLSRKTNQQIVIHDNVQLIVVAVNGDRVKLGFIAPSNVPIYREEMVLADPRQAKEQPT